MTAVPRIDVATWSWWLDMRDDALTPAVAALSAVTGPTMVAVYAVVVAAVACMRTRRIWPAAVLPVAVLAANLASHLLKAVIGRERPPEELRLVVETNHALPSGHATGVAAFAMVLTLWLSRVPGSRIAGRWLIPGIWVLALAVSLTRLYLGVHWLTDVLAGLALGAVVGAVVWGLGHPRDGGAG